MPEPGEVLTEGHAGALVQLAGWPDFERDAGAALARLGFDGLVEVGRAAHAGDRTLYRVAPDRLWLRGGDAAEAMALAGPALVALDLTQSRRCLTLRHEALAEVAPLFLSHDLRPRRWPIGAVLQTGIHGVAVLTHRTGEETLDILVPSTWAVSTLGFLTTLLAHRAAA